MEALETEGVKPIELSFQLPKGPETKIHIHLTINSTSLLLFLTTVNNGDTSATAPLGSFVYALPNIFSKQPTINPLYSQENTLDFTTRMAKLLAKKTGKPVYVGNSISFASAGMGGVVEEEMEGFRKVVEVVLEEVRKSGNTKSDKVVTNGTHVP